MFSMFGNLLVISRVNTNKRITGKLRITILLHFGLVTFRSAYGKYRKPFISMISGFSDASLSPKTNIIHLWRHQGTTKNRKTSHMFFINIRMWEIQISVFVSYKNRAPGNPDDPSNTILKILDTGPTSSW